MPIPARSDETVSALNIAISFREPPVRKSSESLYRHLSKPICMLPRWLMFSIAGARGKAPYPRTRCAGTKRRLKGSWARFACGLDTLLERMPCE